MPGSGRVAVVLTPLMTCADPFLPVSRDAGPSCSGGARSQPLPRLRNSGSLHSTPSLLAAYDACATSKEQEMLLSTIKCGPLQR